MTESMKTPTAKASVASEALVRPDWTVGENQGADMLWLNKNENFDPALARVIEEVVARVGTEAQYRYPDLAPLYKKLALWLGVSPNNLLLAAGSDGCIRACFEAFVSPGDTVLHTAPTFAMYFVNCKIFGANEVQVPHEASDTGPVLPAARLIDAIQESRPKLVCLPNPDSPTGTAFNPADMRAIIEAAGAVGAVMLVDEAYYPFHNETCLPWINDYPNLVVARSTGKAWGMAGFRIGYAAAAPELAAILHKVRAMYEVGAFSAAVFEGMLDHVDAMEASVARLEAGKKVFLDAMEGLGLRTLRGKGNFLHVAFGEHAARVHAALADVVYYRRDFKEPSLAGFSRFSATTAETFDPIIERIRETVGGS